MPQADQQPFNAPVIVDAHGRPARRTESDRCPNCGAGPDQRKASCGFGTVVYPVCPCGYQWLEERWHG